MRKLTLYPTLIALGGCASVVDVASPDEDAARPAREASREAAEPARAAATAGAPPGGALRAAEARPRADAPEATRPRAEARPRTDAPGAAKAEPSARARRARDEGRGASRRRAPAPSPGVEAGAADDNLQFNAFLQFVKKNRHLALAQRTDDRVRLSVRDRAGRPLSQAEVHVDGRLRRRTHADGTALLHPARWGAPEDAEVRVTAEGAEARVALGQARGRALEVVLDVERAPVSRVPLDVAFVLDTTGSMGDELRKLRRTLDTIVFQVSALRPRPKLRLGMVLYRDRGDAYVTRVIPFTPDIERFERALARVRPGGGGDTPEDVQAGLRTALRELDWREGLQLAFLIGDAAPHLDYGQRFTYLDAANEAARRGMKIATIGASGLDRTGELVWRQIAQATSAPFVFLTYGETGDSEGSASTVSHHVGSNWVAADLDAIVVRMVKLELLHFRDEARRPRKDYFTAAPDPRRPPDAVLDELFARSAKQLVDYALEPLEPRTPTVLLPLRLEEGAPSSVRAPLERRMALGLARKPEFQLVARDAEEALLKTIAGQLSASYDGRERPAPGKLLPAELAVLGKLNRGKAGQVDLLIELVRLETGEVLSLSLLEIDERLL